MTSDPLHVVWVVGYAILFGVALNSLNEMLFKGLITLKGTPWHWFAPFLEAGGLKIMEGLDRFSGKEILSVWTTTHTQIISSVVICYVIAPPLFVWGLRERVLWRQGSGQRRFPTKIVLALGLSVSILIGVAFHSTISAFIAYSVRLSLMNAQKTSANKEAVTNDLNYVAMKAQSFYYVDVKDGGGGGRWMNIRRDGNSTVGIDEIGLSAPIIGTVVGKLFPQQPSRFVLTVHTADSITIKGVATEEGDLNNFENADGRRGRIQTSIVVTPKRIAVAFDN